MTSFEEDKYTLAEIWKQLDEGDLKGLKYAQQSLKDFIEMKDACESSSVHSQPEEWQFLNMYTLMSSLILAKKRISSSATWSYNF